VIEVIQSSKQFEIFRNNLESESIGCVPTMGNLHDGHLSLIKESLKHNRDTIVTIFVNPKQFGPNEDFEQYPRTLGQDKQKIKELLKETRFKGKRLTIFAPETSNEIYPGNYDTTITVGSKLTAKLCGESRPGHFDGVTTVVYRLLSLVKPQKTYFGQKDYQQYLIIKKMVEDLMIPIQIIPLPIQRDEDGLALSSRNIFLSLEERKMAHILPDTIDSIKKTIKENTWVKAIELALSIREEVIAKDSGWDYLEVLDAKDLSTPNSNTHTVLIAGAFKAGDTRLIDNKLVEIQNA
jgi:pantoate--beta-alanine ligase